MSIQDIGSAGQASALPLSTAKAFSPTANDVDDRRIIRVATDWAVVRPEADDFVSAPWGARPAPVLAGDPPEGAFTRMLHGVDRLALGLIYLAVLAGLPLAVFAVVTGTE